MFRSGLCTSRRSRRGDLNGVAGWALQAARAGADTGAFRLQARAYPALHEGVALSCYERYEIGERPVAVGNYSVLSGHPAAGEVVSGSSAHYDITVSSAAGALTVAVNIQSVDGSEVLYVVKENFTPPAARSRMAESRMVSTTFT